MMVTQETPLVGYQPKLLNRVEVAEGTMAFQFEKPPGFDFKPGQSTDRDIAKSAGNRLRSKCPHFFSKTY